MKIYNATNVQITAASFKGSDTLRAICLPDYHWVDPMSGPVDLPVGESRNYIKVLREKHTIVPPFTMWPGAGVFGSQECVEVYVEQEEQVVIVERDGRLQAVNLSAVRRRWEGISPVAVARGYYGALATGIDISQKVLASLGKALSAVPVFGEALDAALTSVSLILGIGNAFVEDPPGPPNITMISEVVRDIVREELHSTQAAEYASRFISAFESVTEETYTLSQQVKDLGYDPKFPAKLVSIPEMSRIDYDSFKGKIKKYADASDEYQLAVNHIGLNPEWGKFMAPAFIQGITADICAHWMWDAIRFYEDTKITKVDVQAFVNKVKRRRGELDATRAYLEAFIQRKLNEANLQGTSMGDGEIRSLITKFYTGKQNLNFFADARRELDAIVENIEQDLRWMSPAAGSARESKLYIKEGWRVRKAKKK